MLVVLPCCGCCGKRAGRRLAVRSVLVFAGIERFLVEIVRARTTACWARLRYAQLASVILVAIGMLLMVMWRRGASPMPGSYLETGSRTPASKS